jgi:integrase
MPLGCDLRFAKDELVKIEAKNVQGYNFDLDSERVQAKGRDGKTQSFKFSDWCDKYPHFDDILRKRSLADELRIIRLHLMPFFGGSSIADIQRQDLCEYIAHRSQQHLIRDKKRESIKAVSRGTISNELSLLRRILRLASREGYRVKVPSFDNLIVRVDRSGRALSLEEQRAALMIYPKWMARVAEFAVETCLSQGDILRLTEEMVDWERGVIVPKGGRKKTGVHQVSPLTQRAREILAEINAERRRGSLMPKVAGLIFTRDDGAPISKHMLHAQVKRAVKSGIRKFKFHDYRNTAMTQWRRRGIAVDAVMRAGGWTSVQMYKRYLDINEDDIAKAFGTSQIDNRLDKREESKSI